MVAKKTRLFVLGLIIFILTFNLAFAAIKTFHVQETDLVKISAEAIDPDNDNVTYYYPQPFDKDGVWQTGYNDAGEYELEIVASDGLNKSSKKIRIIVENKNQKPILTENKVVVKETQTLDLKKIITDVDGDALTYSFTKPFDKNGLWTPGYNDAGDFITTIKVTDGEFMVEKKVEIEVLNTNQPPELLASFSSGRIFDVKENSKLHFFIDVEDSDHDPISYLWELDDLIIGEENSGDYYFNYESSGEHSLKVFYTDGQNEQSKEWVIRVENVNRRPQLDLLPVTVREGEKVSLDYPELDLDGDALSYSFELPLDANGEWQTTYADAGEYNLEVIASDGEYSTSQNVKIIVVDVDQATTLALPPMLSVREGEELSWKIITADPDGDEIKVELEGLPEGAKYDSRNNLLTWTPDYNTIQRNSGFVSKVLNALRLEHFFLKKRSFPVKITACGKALCSSETIDLIVYNVNRAPKFTLLQNVTFKELDLVTLEAQAIDPDGDIVKLAYSKPLNYKGQWQTDYDDEGRYIIYVSATDGQLTTTQAVGLDILKNNRQPTLNVDSDEITVNEGQEFSLEVSAQDPDNDELKLKLENPPQGASFKDGIFTWKPGYDIVTNKTSSAWDALIKKNAFFNKKFNKDFSIVWLNFVASDEEFDVVHPVKVKVVDFNQKPEILDYLPNGEIVVNVNEPVVFQATVKDGDNDPLTYQWYFGLKQSIVKGTNAVERTFTSPGMKKVKLTVSDGLEKVEKEWVVKVVGEPLLVEEEPFPVIPNDPFSVRVYVIKS